MYDFVDLDIAFGCDGKTVSSYCPGTGILYYNEWEAENGGILRFDNTFSGRGKHAYYWTQTVSGTYSYLSHLQITASNKWREFKSTDNYNGMHLRCVRDNN